ncbi:hypothetical protein CORC01_01618 [Colletotrichum orchidophilum]|uniref:Uncharacterized protein n=1 Tax=Colletotrichum orchidophilum TaxID=1209926 RepID=A0A1G4BP77_9PEZI|nr:uncharacterized protein CORC01_01618 [Colletotrichum orchidophilum]OHF03234.1 hypothetical protein CORC01_01618 [Colletotrichum orchidophilum]
MGTGQGNRPSNQQQQQQQQQAPYPPQQRYYVQQPQPPQPQPQYQQQYQPYQPPQQTQYYNPPRQPQYASRPTSPQPPHRKPTQQQQQQQQWQYPAAQQQFLAELEVPASVPRPTSTSSPTTTTTTTTTSTPVPSAGATQHGPVAYEMPADDAVAVKSATHQIPRKPHRIASASSVAAASSTSPPPASPAAARPETKHDDDPDQQTGQKQAPPPQPLIQANPWGFFLEDDIPPRNTHSATPSKDDATPEDQTLSVKPLRIVKTGSTEESSGQASRSSSSVADDVTPPQPLQFTAAAPAVQGSNGSDLSQLAPAPLRLARPQSPAAQPRPSRSPSPAISTAPAPEASKLPYPAEGPSIPTADSHPHHQSGPQTTLPFHIRPAGSPSPVSPSFAPSHFSPSPTGISAPHPQLQSHQHHPQQSQPHPQPAYTQPASVSPVILQSVLPPTLPVSSYFPQQPSYARQEAMSPSLSAHHSPIASTSRPSTSHGASQASQHFSDQPYASPPPSYNQAMSQMHLANTSPTPTQTQWLPPSRPPPLQNLSPNPAGVPLPLSPPPTQYTYSPTSMGAQSLSPLQQQFTGYNMPPPPVRQPTYVNGTQYYQPQPTPTPPPLPPRNSPTMPGTPHTGYGALTPYGGPPPPTRPNYQAPPPKAESRLFSSATARKLLTKTTELVDQTITPYLQDSRYYRPPQNWYQNQNQSQSQFTQQNYQYPNRPSTSQGQQQQQQQQQHYQQQQSYAPSQRV